MLKMFYNCIISALEHCDPHNPVIAIDGTFNTNDSKYHTIIFILVMDCNHEY